MINIMSIFAVLPLEIALSCMFCSLFPVDGEDVILIILRRIDLKQRVCFLRVIAGKERPVGRSVLPAVA